MAKHRFQLENDLVMVDESSGMLPDPGRYTFTVPSNIGKSGEIIIKGRFEAGDKIKILCMHDGDDLASFEYED